MAPSIENKLNQNPHEKDSLEEKVSFTDAVSQFSKWDIAGLTGAFALGGAFGGGFGGSFGGLGFGPINTAATIGSYTGASYLVNRKEGFTKNQIKTEMYLGAAVTPLLHQFFNYMDGLQASTLGYAGIYGALMVPFTGVVHGMHYMIEKYNPWTFTKSLFTLEPIRDVYNIAKNTVTSGLYSGLIASVVLTPIVTALHLFVPVQYMILSLVPIRTTFRYILEKFGKKKEPEPEEERPGPTDINRGRNRLPPGYENYLPQGSRAAG